MKSSLRSIVITVLLAFAAGFAGIAIGSFAFNGAIEREPTLHEVVHDELDLTSEQLAVINRLEGEFAARRRALELEMRSANADLAASFREEARLGPRVTAAVERFHDAMGRLQTATLEHLLAMRAVLTPTQQQRFDDTVVGALTADPK